jgi:hypothetical protein
MAYRLSPGVPLLLVKDRSGGIKYHYGSANGSDAANGFGPEIAWLNDEQKDHFLRLNLVVEIPDSDSIPETLAVTTPGTRA